jgi:hypothetical protein
VNICSFKQQLPGRGFILHHSLPMIVHCRIFKFGTQGPETPSHSHLLRRLLSESASEQPPSPRQASDAPAAGCIRCLGFGSTLEPAAKAAVAAISVAGRPGPGPA